MRFIIIAIDKLVLVLREVGSSHSVVRNPVGNALLHTGNLVCGTWRCSLDREGNHVISTLSNILNADALDGNVGSHAPLNGCEEQAVNTIYMEGGQLSHVVTNKQTVGFLLRKSGDAHKGTYYE